MVNCDTWTFVNSFAPWLSAVGTLAAVVFSLYITLADRSRVRVRAWMNNEETTSDGESTYKLISIRVIKTRDKEVFIDKVSWNIGGTIIPQTINYTFAVRLDLTGPSMLISKVPAQINFDLDTFKKHYIDSLAPPLAQSDKRVRIGVAVSTG